MKRASHKECGVLALHEADFKLRFDECWPLTAVTLKSGTVGGSGGQFFRKSFRNPGGPPCPMDGRPVGGGPPGRTPGGGPPGRTPRGGPPGGKPGGRLGGGPGGKPGGGPAPSGGRPAGGSQAGVAGASAVVVSAASWQPTSPRRPPRAKFVLDFMQSWSRDNTVALM